MGRHPFGAGSLSTGRAGKGSRRARPTSRNRPTPWRTLALLASFALVLGVALDILAWRSTGRGVGGTLYARWFAPSPAPAQVEPARPSTRSKARKLPAAARSPSRTPASGPTETGPDTLPEPTRVPSPPNDPRLAIVLDDAGAQAEDLEPFLAMETPLTFAILPFEAASAACAESARAHGHGVILHLPMEPLSYPEDDPGPHAVFRNLDTAAVARRVREAFASVPGAEGFNNHMGSAATADPRLMRDVMRAAGTGHYFLDSRTTASTVGFEAAQQAGLPAVRRDVFLDGVEEAAAIEAQLRRAGDLALERGTVIAIGHVRPLTAQVLHRVVPDLEADGVRLVPLRELVDAQARAGGRP